MVSDGAESLQLRRAEKLRDDTRVARAVAFGTLALSVAATPLYLVMLPQYRVRWLVVLSVVVAASFALVRLSSAGRSRLGGILYVATLFAMLIGLELRGGGTTPPAFWGFVIVTLMAGLLIGKRGALIVGAICCLAGLGMAFLESSGRLEAAVVDHTPYSRWLVNVLYISLAVSLHRLSIGATREALLRVESELAQRVSAEGALRTLAARFEVAADERAALVQKLGERVKELTLLHQTARLLQSERPPDVTFLTELVNLIPRGWQHNDVCEARIVIGALDVRTGGWRETQWMQTVALDAGDQSGRVEVVYTEARAAQFEGPFLAEERTLLESLAELLTSWLEHHQSAAALRRREAEFSGMFEGAAIGIALVGEDGVPITTNPAFSKFLGYTREELTRMNFGEFTHPDDIEQDMIMYREMINRQREYYQLEKRYLRKDGATVWGRLTVSSVREQNEHKNYFVGMVEDITATKEAESERARLQAQLLQSQKMEAMGLLAGGVAHDFNNLITIISGYCDLLLARRHATPDSREMITEIRDAGTRAASLTRQLLAFSRRAVFETAVLDPNTLIRDMEGMLARLIGEDVQLTTSLSHDAGRVKVDRNQLEQALVNLVVNARDAMPTGGKLLIETSTIDVDTSYTNVNPDAETGRHVVISVTDSGCGMSEETRSRIFEPFFTTKQRDRGTGLGLAMVYGFAKQCDGHVTVTTALGKGSTFRLVLPHVVERLSSDRTTPQYVALVTGKERIMLVEDDSGVRALTRHILAECGYDVVAIGNPTEAAAMPDAQLQQMGMLLTDVVMPQLSGRQLADQLRQRSPKLKVLYMSGYTDDAIMRHGVLESSVHFLQKPFTPQSLSVKVREVLDSA